jgi:hypothetical protein
MPDYEQLRIYILWRFFNEIFTLHIPATDKFVIIAEKWRYIKTHCRQECLSNSEITLYTVISFLFCYADLKIGSV